MGTFLVQAWPWAQIEWHHPATLAVGGYGNKGVRLEVKASGLQCRTYEAKVKIQGNGT